MSTGQLNLSDHVVHEAYATLGRMTAGIAHEIINPVTFAGNNVLALQSYVDSLEEIIELIQNLGSDETASMAGEKIQRLREAADKVQSDSLLDELRSVTHETLSGIQEIASLVTVVRQYANCTTENFVRTDVNECLDAVVRLTRNEHKYKCSIDLQLNAEQMILAKPRELNFVLMALLLKLVEVVDKDGRLVIQTKNDRDYVSVLIAEANCLSAPVVPVVVDHQHPDSQLSTIARIAAHHGATVSGHYAGHSKQGYQLLFPIAIA